jgi:hypothetical protein
MHDATHNITVCHTFQARGDKINDGGRLEDVRWLGIILQNIWHEENADWV